ncbi:MAG: hypothetical protein JRI26_00755 [Deltaproteobacteria bacterium]|nr:hypothetical protein [Deltaproteobacteria bacterium]
MTKISIRNVLLAALSGLMLTASFAPVNLDWIAWISLIPLLISLEDKSLSDAFKIGLFVGLFHYILLSISPFLHLSWLILKTIGYHHFGERASGSHLNMRDLIL